MCLRRRTVLLIYLQIVIIFFNDKKCNALGEWSKLRLVQVIFNNGDRAPTTDYPKMPNHNRQWQEGPGELTAIGMWQQYNLGGFFRRRYTKYLNPVYHRHQIYVESADVDCRLMSAQCHLAGLYPSVSLRIPLQPVPVHSLPADQKHMLEFDEPCRRYDMLYHQAMQSKEARSFLKLNKELMSKVAEEAGWPESTLKNMWKTYEVLYCMKAHNISLPKWVNESMYQTLGSLAAMQYRFQTFTTEMQRLKAGTFLNLMLQRMQQACKSDKTVDERMKFYLYSSLNVKLKQRCRPRSAQCCIADSPGVESGILTD